VSARRAKKDKDRARAAWYESRWLSGLLLWALAAYMALALTDAGGPWWRALLGSAGADLLPPGNPGGPVGALVNLALRVVFGAAWCWFLPALLVLGGLSILMPRRTWLRPVLQRAVPLWVTSVSWLGQPDGPLAREAAAAWSGIIGIWVGRGFHFLFGLWGGRIFLTFLLLTAATLSLRPILTPAWRRLVGLQRGCLRLAGWLRAAGHRLAGLACWLGRGMSGWGRALVRVWSSDQEATADLTSAGNRTDRQQTSRRQLHGEGERAASTTSRQPAAVEAIVPVPPSSESPAATPAGSASARPTPAASQAPVATRSGPVELPSLELLHASGLDVQSNSPAALDAAADLLEETLRSFGVVGEVKEVRPGPVVTTFEYQPAAGIKVSQIVQRADDLALAMKARSIRMEAPIPGKAAVGIEIPNAAAQTVRLKEVLERVRDELSTPLAAYPICSWPGRPAAARASA
jgi:hypothetical protein